MKNHFHLLISALLLFILPSATNAQVEKLPPSSRYCHHATHDFELRPLSENEIIARDATIARSDTFDLLHIGINLEIINFTAQVIKGHTAITFSPKINGVTVLPLDLRSFNIDSVLVDDVLASYTYNDVLLNVDFLSPMSITDTAIVKVYYNGHPIPDPSGFGGLIFENGYAYNLGIGLASNPFNYGRGWFPCFDNFVERSTYEFNIITANNRKAYCTGTFMSQVSMGGDTIMRSYYLDQPIPTYLAGVAVSTYSEVNQIHETAYGPLPIQLVAKTGDTTAMKSTFADLGNAVDAIESWYGQYQWERVGYVATVVGAMEHPTNIAYPVSFAVNGNSPAQKRLMAHELAHCWWGNVVTLTSPANMWIKEGNAEYGAHLLTLYLNGQDAFITQVKGNFLDVLTTAHFDDNDFLPLSGIPYEYTYGTHTYFKGASMIHNLRAYMGDELFSTAMTDVLETFAYSAIDAEMYRDHFKLCFGN